MAMIDTPHEYNPHWADGGPCMCGAGKSAWLHQDLLAATEGIADAKAVRAEPFVPLPPDKDPSAAGKTDRELFAAELHRIAVAVETGHANVYLLDTYPFLGGAKTEVILTWPSTSSTSPSPRTSS